MTNNKELFLKWMKNLYNVQIVVLVCSILAAIPLIGTVMGWVSLILSAVVVYILYQMAPVNDRYRKATIFTGIGVGINIIAKFASVGILSFVGSICTLIGFYQEYSAHSDMLDGIDAKLAKKWHSLFNWQLIGGIILGVLGAPIVVLLGVSLLIDTNILTTVVLVLVTCFDTVIRIIYLRYLKRTREMYEAFPENMVDGQTGDYI